MNPAKAGKTKAQKFLAGVAFVSAEDRLALEKTWVAIIYLTHALLTHAVCCRYEVLFTEMGELRDDAPPDGLIHGEEPLAMPLDLGGVDLGVEKWARMPVEKVMKILGFPRHRPTLFAPWRSKSCQEYDNFEHLPEDDREAITLHWHQAVADAALTECFWTKVPVAGGVPGVLLADNVGLGKTLEIMGLIAMIVQTRIAELAGGGVRAKIISEFFIFDLPSGVGAL